MGSGWNDSVNADREQVPWGVCTTCHVAYLRHKDYCPVGQEIRRREQLAYDKLVEAGRQELNARLAEDPNTPRIIRIKL